MIMLAMFTNNKISPEEKEATREVDRKLNWASAVDCKYKIYRARRKGQDLGGH